MPGGDTVRWRLVSERRSRPCDVVVLPPVLSADSDLLEGEVHTCEAVLPQASGERLNERLVGARARTTERRLDTMTMRPRTSLLEGELGTTSDLDELWWTAMRSPVSDRSAAMPAHSWIVESASETGETALRRPRSCASTLKRSLAARAMVRRGARATTRLLRSGGRALRAGWGVHLYVVDGLVCG